jgi:hypothetical protein
MTTTTAVPDDYPVRFAVDYPDRPLDRTTTAARALLALPAVVLLALVSGTTWQWSESSPETFVASAGGLLFLAPALMILFRRTYPRWWFDWNLELQRFSNRVSAYVALMDDRYPSATDHQSVHLDYELDPEPNRWLPLVKWLLAIPHWVVLAVLNVAAIVAVVAAWFAIVATGRYPRSIFRFVEGVLRWNNRVIGYALTLVTDRYPPFSLS